MPWPDSIDRVSSITVYYNPATGESIATTDPARGAQLISQGFSRRVVQGSNWNEFLSTVGDKFRDERGAPSQTPTLPVSAPAGLTPEEIAAFQQQKAQLDAESAADLENLRRGFEIGQTSLARSVDRTREDYGAKVQPTLLAGAFSGAGYHQSLNDLYLAARDRDYSLAGLEDQAVSDRFQQSLSLTRALRSARDTQNDLATRYVNSLATQQQNRSPSALLDSMFKFLYPTS